jgi:hypothetical protein
METIHDSEHYYYVCDDQGYRIGLEPVDPRPKKRVRVNPLGENAYLRPNGSVKREEDLVVACQRMWLHNAYRPEGPMYKKHRANFYTNQK